VVVVVVVVAVLVGIGNRHVVFSAFSVTQKINIYMCLIIIQGIRPCLRLFEHIRNKLIFTVSC
jgi:hypothetical protein